MKIIGKVITGICALFLLWAFFSWVDVVSDNCSPNPQHSDLNLFVMMTESAKEDGVAGIAIKSADERVTGALAFFPVDEYTSVVCTPHN